MKRTYLLHTGQTARNIKTNNRYKHYYYGPATIQKRRIKYRRLKRQIRNTQYALVFIGIFFITLLLIILS